jgi:hypothetical protein
VAGRLLASQFSTTRIPAEYLHGDTFQLRIALIDHYGRSHRSLIEVRVDRSATMTKASVSTPFGEGLNGGRPQEQPVFNYTSHQELHTGGGNAVPPDCGGSAAPVNSEQSANLTQANKGGENERVP